MVYRPYLSVVPAAMDALVAIFTAKFAVAAPLVLVKDGPWVSEESEQDLLAVGWSGFVPGYQYPSRSMSEELGTPDVASEGMAEGMGPSIRQHFTVTCASISRRGGDPIAVARRAAYANQSIAAGAIAPPNHTWGGVVLQSQVSLSESLHQVKDRRGALAIVVFTVEAQAFAQQ